MSGCDDDEKEVMKKKEKKRDEQKENSRGVPVKNMSWAGQRPSDRYRDVRKDA